MEHILSYSNADVEQAVDKYFVKCEGLGVDTIEIGTGFLSIPGDDWLRLTDRMQKDSFRAKPDPCTYSDATPVATRQLDN